MEILFPTICNFKRLLLLGQYSRHGIIWDRILQKWTHFILPLHTESYLEAEKPNINL